ncbi:MAG: metalloregulator ArsR/SmtB family transcription factor [Caldilineaceae bacterium]
MARLATTSDVFNAIAAPQRRAILELLTAGELSVAEIAEALDLNQPQASKHLRVLHEVDLVNVRREGRQRIYQLQSESLKPIHDWVDQFEQFWSERFDRLDTYLQSLQTGIAQTGASQTGETDNEQSNTENGTAL